MAAPSFEAKLARLRETFIRQLPEQVMQARRALEACPANHPGQALLEALHRSVHTLRGSCASFKLAALAEVAAEGETLLQALLKGDLEPQSQWHDRIGSCLEKMELILAQTPLAARSALPEPEVASSDSGRPGQKVKSVFLCEEEPLLCQALADQLACFGFEVTAFIDLEAFQGAALECRPDAIVMDLWPSGRPLGGAEVAAALRAKHGVPLVILTSRGDLSCRLAAVRAGACAYFMKPVNVTILASTLDALTQQEETDPCRILIVDDDAHLAELHAATLQGVGMETRILTDPLEALPELFDFRPDLILMDMHMPGCSGVDLAKVIRQIDSFLSIPIVFLSSETDLDMQFDARRMGGDEFLAKPIKPDHLIAAVAVRAERMKLLRSQVVRDGMTGLFNHTAAKAHLEDVMARAERSGREFCFAMIDLDKFKSVNDTYGHPVGDRVLVVLANLLRQRLRKTDIVGRYGGEEFAVILPDCPLPEAIACLDQLRESFGGIRFVSGEREFTSSFSCGVASSTHFPDARQLGQAADEALYAAKRGGRNRVAMAATPCLDRT
jgi:diguanylate cyclase (GGDEF)-like protein